MSFSGFLKSLSDKASELKTDVLKFKNKKFLDAAMAVSALMAMADKEITKDEKQKMLRFIESYDPLSVFKLDEVINAFQTSVNALDFDFDIGEAKLLGVIRGFKGDDMAARLLMRMGISIAGADGNFDSMEMKMAIKICNELGLNPKDFELN